VTAGSLAGVHCVLGPQQPRDEGSGVGGACPWVVTARSSAGVHCVLGPQQVWRLLASATTARVSRAEMGVVVVGVLDA
jgi:hypothetical protein